MDNIREHIYLAALLHDIGKFYQRADTGSVKTSKFLKDYCRNESTFCPEHKGYYSHKHVLWTAQFIDTFKPIFQKLASDDLNNLSNKDNLINLAAGHHLPSSQLSEQGKIIKEADCLSSGMDRDSDIALLDEQDESKDWDSFKKKRMVSILETINYLQDNRKTSPTKWMHIPVKKLSLSKECFPKSSFDNDPDYLSLWEQFISEFKFIQADTYHAFSETLLNLLFKYTNCIPSSTINFPDISLYDHLKTSAALAVCLYDYRKSKCNYDNPFLLIGADFSGIQPYIYQIVSKYAGKNLKGRSFYLRILSDAVVRFILKQLNLYQANVVYNSGGGFYILAPNTPKTKELLNDSITTIENNILRKHGTSLFVAIDSIEVSTDTLMHRNGNLGTVWHELFTLRDQKKESKFNSIITNNYTSFFTPINRGGNTKRDIITGEEFQPGEITCSFGELTPIKQVTREQIELGQSLRESEIMVISEVAIPYWQDKIKIQPIGLGFTYYFLKQKELSKMQSQLRASADKISVITLNGKNGDCDFMGRVTGINNIYGLDFYGGNENDTNGIPTFDDMCSSNENEATFKRLGVLRMDVDNLGYIFQKGISPERSTLSRYATLSRSFDFFFSGYINTIIREIDPSKSFIIYSGGDDLFIIGSWDVTTKIATRINDDFKSYCCNNPALTISGGIAIIPAKYPIMKGADESEKEERLAKNHSCEKLQKNSISFLSSPLNWDLEFPQVEQLTLNIIQFTKDEILPKSFISKIIAHNANAEIKNHKIGKIKTYWMITYDLSRLEERINNAPAKELINNCKTEVCGNKHSLNGVPVDTNYHQLELWALACRLAELELRTNI